MDKQRRERSPAPKTKTARLGTAMHAQPQKLHNIHLGPIGAGASTSTCRL